MIKVNIKTILVLYRDQLPKDIDIIYLIALKVKIIHNNQQVWKHQREEKNLKDY